MKTINTKKESKKNKTIIKNGEILYTLDHVFAKASKTKAFKKTYQEEVMRLKLVQEIKKLRTAQKLTQQAVAKRSGMTQSIIARIESGEHTMSLDTLGKIAHAFGKEVELV